MDSDFIKSLQDLHAEKRQQISEMESQVEKLMSQINALAAESKAIEVLLRSARASQDGGDDLEPKGETQQPASLKGVGFRDAVRAILADFPEGLTAGEIRRELEGRGYVYDAQTPLPVRISNETLRMAKQGMIERRDNRNILTRKGREMAQEAQDVK